MKKIEGLFLLNICIIKKSYGGARKSMNEFSS